ncbi:hypothetical protein [Bradyrhizobium sp. CCBAU 51753]|uniref:hypothetical protein n=1 Tax=Bradyrhizobium sp. CCBAU 51753 TaxID=1325100 RepID=UPI00188CCDD4|nr:hypothetical protein [Bradyrhizobium sp. CCBAU 51753]
MELDLRRRATQAEAPAQPATGAARGYDPLRGPPVRLDLFRKRDCDMVGPERTYGTGWRRQLHAPPPRILCGKMCMDAHTLYLGQSGPRQIMLRRLEIHQTPF